MMPDLPNVGWHRDLESFTEFFENPAFRTDGLKVYPTLVIRGTGLYELWKTGLYRNYDPRLLVDLVARILALVPPWVRSPLLCTPCRCSPNLACGFVMQVCLVPGLWLGSPHTAPCTGYTIKL